MTETTVDKLLNGRFEVEQPAKGYRIAVDTLLLASAIPAREGQRTIEFGCGVGGVMLALASRAPQAHILGVELQAGMVDLCASNIRRNGFADRLKVEQGDIAQLSANYAAGFDNVVMNPPYHDHKTHTVSSNQSKRLAHAESDNAELSVWIAQAAHCLKIAGVMTVIHRSDRLEDVLENARGLFDVITIKPIIARTGASPKRIIVRAVKGSGMPSEKVLSPLILYGDDNRYSEEAESILRHAQAMRFE